MFASCLAHEVVTNEDGGTSIVEDSDLRVITVESSQDLGSGDKSVESLLILVLLVDAS